MNVDDFFARIAAHAGSKPALAGDDVAVDYRTLHEHVARLATLLETNGTRVFATLLDNGPAWVIADLAALRSRVVHVPLPTFFTPEQTAFALDAAGVDTVLAQGPQAGFGSRACGVSSEPLTIGSRTGRCVPLATGTAKITFTSGTTGAPKGVCLSADAMLAVADGLAHAMAPLAVERHLCALPLAVLLENVAGIYAPLLAGATSIVVPTRTLGLEGASRFAAGPLDAAVRGRRADSVIVLPQMLRLWTAWRRAMRGQSVSAPRFIAVGGAALGGAAIEQARAVGLPAFEGYGLSEGASVQTLNLPGADRPGSVGRALPHARLHIADDGEIEIGDGRMLGYVGEPYRRSGWWRTGDLGAIDDDGYLHVRGRKKNVLITGFGRNVSPEWIEALLAAQPEIAQAVVQGDGKPALEAVLWPVSQTVRDDELAAAVERANAGLPDYARVARFVRAHVPFAPAAGVCTPNGRPLRGAIEEMHAAALAVNERASDALL